MRTSDQINDIKERQSNPVQFINAITKEKIDFLIDYYKSTNKIQKNTGKWAIKRNKNIAMGININSHANQRNRIERLTIQ